MDRAELRFRILFEHYQEYHSKDPQKYDVRAKIQKIAMPDHEKRAARTWLIDEGYVQGSNHSYSGSAVPLPLIGRIVSNGVNYVEYVMDVAFTEIADDVSGIKELSKKERIDKFANDCLNEIAGQICKATLNAITSYMTSGSPN